tara:strand:- start:3340 stop:3804 length:465 start_codon:yes stop_codon:yes gene_type:complete
MNVVKNVDQFDINNAILCEPIKNNIINDGKFIRIIYSNDVVTFNGIYLLIELKHTSCIKHYSKYKCDFNIEDHVDLIHRIKIIETELLNKFNVCNKVAQYKINEALNTGSVKIHTNINSDDTFYFILKISGIWETEHKYGLTYKFCKNYDEIKL